MLVLNNAEMLCMVHQKFVQDLCVRFAVKSEKVEIMHFPPYFPPFSAFGLARSGLMGWPTTSAERVRNLSRLQPHAYQQESRHSKKPYAVAVAVAIKEATFLATFWQMRHANSTHR
jgi:hypothetical protein